MLGIGLNSLEFPGLTQNIQVGYPVGVPEFYQIWVNPSNSPALGANHVMIQFTFRLHPDLTEAEMRDLDIELDDPDGTWYSLDLSAVTPYLSADETGIIFPLASSIDLTNSLRVSYTPGTLRSPVNELVEAFTELGTTLNESDVERLAGYLDSYPMTEASGIGTPRAAAKQDNGASSKDLDATIAIAKSTAFLSGAGVVFTGLNYLVMDISNTSRNSEYDKLGPTGPPTEQYTDGKFTIAWRARVNTLPSLGASGDTAYWWEKWTGVGTDRSWVSFVQATGADKDILYVSGSNAANDAFSLKCSSRGVLVAGVIYSFVAVYDPDNNGIIVYSKNQAADDFTIDDGALAGPGAATPEVRSTSGTRHLSIGRLDDRPDITGTEIDLEGFYFHLGAWSEATARAFCEDNLNHPFNPA